MPFVASFVERGIYTSTNVDWIIDATQSTWASSDCLYILRGWYQVKSCNILMPYLRYVIYRLKYSWFISYINDSYFEFEALMQPRYSKNSFLNRRNRSWSVVRLFSTAYFQPSKLNHGCPYAKSFDIYQHRVKRCWTYRRKVLQLSNFR